MNTLLQGLRAVAEPTRLRILGICAHAELTASDIVQILGQSQPRISRHLKLMVDAGLLERNQEGNWAYYQIPRQSYCAELARTIVDIIPDDDPDLSLDLDRLQSIKQQRAELAAEYFRKNASDWEALRELHVDSSKVDAALIKQLGQDKIGSLLDIGTGTGHILRLLANKAEDAIGVDASLEMLAVARSSLDKTSHPNVQVRQGDMYKLPFKASRFDIITIHMVLHYAEYPERALKEAARVLKPGGKIVLVDFEPHNLEQLRDQHAHRWLGFETSKIENLMQNAGLNLDPTTRLDGEAITVSLWTGVKAANDHAQQLLNNGTS